MKMASDKSREPSDSSRALVEESAFWSRYDTAVSSFCFQLTVQAVDSDKLVSSLVGEELEWCGPQGILFVLNRFISIDEERKELDQRCRTAESLLSSETIASRGLRVALQTTQRTAEDSKWQLQEQLATAKNLLLLEKEGNRELRTKLDPLVEHVTLVKGTPAPVVATAAIAPTTPTASATFKSATFTHTPQGLDRSDSLSNSSPKKHDPERMKNVAQRLSLITRNFDNGDT